MNYVEVIRSQYLASLEMLKETITLCPESIWNSPGDKTKFWHIAYHALFYVHLYLQDSERTFTPWVNHRQSYNFIGLRLPPGVTPPQVDQPYDKESVLEYLAFCRQQVAERVPQLNLEAASGFSWLPFGKFELQIYSIRHLQQHTGELMERLGTRADVEIHWVGMQHSEAE
jgi:hypothetical protein